MGDEMTHNDSRVAVLGGTGFAGKNVCDALNAGDLKYESFNRGNGCDLLDLGVATALLKEYDPMYIVNCAAEVGSLNYVSERAADIVDVNIRMIANLYTIVEKMPDTIIINPIANCAYPGEMDLYSESEFWNGPIHPSVLSFGSTRRMIDVFATSYAQQYGVRSINLITPNMYGPHDSTDPNKTHALNALVVKFLNAVKLGLPQVEVWGTGRPIREWLYVKDFAAIVKQVIQNPYESLELVNVAQNNGHSVKILVDVINELVGYTGSIVYNSQFQDGSPKRVMDDRLFRRLFPSFQFTNLKIGIAETIEYYQTII